MRKEAKRGEGSAYRGEDGSVGDFVAAAFELAAGAVGADFGAVDVVAGGEVGEHGGGEGGEVEGGVGHAERGEDVLGDVLGVGLARRRGSESRAEGGVADVGVGEASAGFEDVVGLTEGEDEGLFPVGDGALNEDAGVVGFAAEGPEVWVANWMSGDG